MKEMRAKNLLTMRCGRSYLLSDPHNMTAPQDMYSDGNNGTIYLQIGRMPNTHWLDESGYTYMCWKW